MRIFFRLRCQSNMSSVVFFLKLSVEFVFLHFGTLFFTVVTAHADNTIFSRASSMAQGMTMLVSRSFGQSNSSSTQAEISRHLLDDLLWNFMHTFLVCRG